MAQIKSFTLGSLNSRQRERKMGWWEKREKEKQLAKETVKHIVKDFISRSHEKVKTTKIWVSRN